MTVETAGTGVPLSIPEQEQQYLSLYDISGVLTAEQEPSATFQRTGRSLTTSLRAIASCHHIWALSVTPYHWITHVYDAAHAALNIWRS